MSFNDDKIKIWDFFHLKIAENVGKRYPYGLDKEIKGISTLGGLLGNLMDRDLNRVLGLEDVLAILENLAALYGGEEDIDYLQNVNGFYPEFQASQEDYKKSFKRLFDDYLELKRRIREEEDRNEVIII